MSAFGVQAIKKRFEEYVELEIDIENQMERLERIINKMESVSSPSMSGMPSGGSSGPDKIANMIIKKEEIEKRIKQKLLKREREKECLENMIGGLRKANERSVLEMRYFDSEQWSDINRMIFGKMDDFDDKRESYLRRVYMLHGSAILNISRNESVRKNESTD